MAFTKEKFKELQAEIEAACNAAGRTSEEVTVLAATKYTNAEAVNEAIKAGVSRIGENRVQDAKQKLGQLLPVQKFFIGHLQTNKVKEAVKLFDGIESIDSLRLAEIVNIEAEAAGKLMPVLLQVNIAADPKKFGLGMEEVEAVLGAMGRMDFLKVRGLMTIVPYFKDPEDARPFFRKMKQLFDRYRQESPDFDTLSMGMSHDFKIAIQEGATEIRIGSYIFDLL